MVEGKERVNEECLDSDASHIGPAAPKEQVISGQVGHSDHIKKKKPALILILSPHRGRNSLSGMKTGRTLFLE